MTNLLLENCVKIDKKTVGLGPDEIEILRKEVPDWHLSDQNGTACLRRTFQFSNFNNALSFTNRVGQLAEDQDHHPAILTEWGRVTVTWWTHAVHGLHRNDFIMAAHTNAIYTTFFAN